MSKTDERMEKIQSLAKRRGFIFQGSELYGGLAGTWDYGPLGVALKRNIIELWWKRYVDTRSDIYGIDAAILMNQRVWEASGHTGAGFTDPLVECSKCHARFRSDFLPLDTDEGGEMKCTNCGASGKDIFSDPRQFNMMFKTHIGASEDSSALSYLRPETAQGIFVNFKNIIDTMRPKFPFGIAQVGKAFRNEIAPRDFIFRTREFEQMEIEYFVREAEWESSFDTWRKDLRDWVISIGVDEKKLHERDQEDVAHYSRKTIDFEYEYPFGQAELFGLAYRTDFDLKNHMQESGVTLEYFNQEKDERFVPHVIEPSLGIERLVLAILDSAYEEEEVEGEMRVVLRFAQNIAPVHVAVLPLMRKDNLPEKAQEVSESLQEAGVRAMYDETGSIGKRYRRQDEIGTPICVTIDYDSLDDDTVTVRNRDTMKQERIAIPEIISYLRNI